MFRFWDNFWFPQAVYFIHSLDDWWKIVGNRGSTRRNTTYPPQSHVLSGFSYRKIVPIRVHQFGRFANIYQTVFIFRKFAFISKALPENYSKTLSCSSLRIQDQGLWFFFTVLLSPDQQPSIADKVDLLWFLIYKFVPFILESRQIWMHQKVLI